VSTLAGCGEQVNEVPATGSLLVGRTSMFEWMVCCGGSAAHAPSDASESVEARTEARYVVVIQAPVGSR
jgi:hypothetical protein